MQSTDARFPWLMIAWDIYIFFSSSPLLDDVSRLQTLGLSEALRRAHLWNQNLLIR